jgi:hypothetical protein
VPTPSLRELDELEDELRLRTERAIVVTERHPPEAVVTFPNCRFCDVKHLCDEYWTIESQQLQREDSPQLRSLQVEVTEPVGSSSSRVAVELDPNLPAGTVALLQGHEFVKPVAGQRLRLLDVRIREGEIPPRSYVIQLGASSEAYLVQNSCSSNERN